jgi:hypothetical protein
MKNSSTRDSLCAFVVEKKSIAWLKNNCWPRECETQINLMKKIGVVNSRQRAKRFLKKNILF